METTALVGACVAVLLGAGLQRVAGMGLGMVAAPILALLLGPATGVVVSNVAAVVTALLVLRALREGVDWGRFAALAPLVLVGSVLGALTVRAAGAGSGTAWLDVLVGGTVLLALAATFALRRQARVEGRPAAVGTGLVAGFMNTTSGVAAPALTAYALATHWEMRAFAATLQPMFVLMNLTSIITKLLLGAVPVAALPPWWLWPAVAGAVAAGVTLGTLVARAVSAQTAAGVAIAVAVAGATGALLRGLFTL
jgi:uncharacterized protein